MAATISQQRVRCVTKEQLWTKDIGLMKVAVKGIHVKEAGKKVCSDTHLTCEVSHNLANSLAQSSALRLRLKRKKEHCVAR